MDAPLAESTETSSETKLDGLQALVLAAMIRTGRRGMTDEQLLEEGWKVWEWLWHECMGWEECNGDPEHANYLVRELFSEKSRLVQSARRQVRRQAAKDPVRRAEASRAAAKGVAASRENRERPARQGRPRTTKIMLAPDAMRRNRARAPRRRARLRCSPARSPGPRSDDDDPHRVARRRRASRRGGAAA
jgi:hypothetical protein